MTKTSLQLVAMVLLAAAITVVYAWRLATDPVYPAHDEIFYAVQAHTVAMTGYDTNGRFLPLYFRMGNLYWASPLHVYLSAVLLRFVHISDAVIRVPSLAVGWLTIGMMYGVGRKAFGSAWWGMATAAFLALTPAQFITSRFKVEAHYPLPFVAGWLLCVLAYQETRRRRWLAASGLVLALGMYTYHAAPLMMAGYVVLTLWLLWSRGELRGDRVAILLASFALLAAPLAAFILAHPEYVSGEMSAYGMYDPKRLGPIAGLMQLLSWKSLTERLVVYSEYFNPSLLFFSGGAAVIESTQHAGVFLLSYAVLLPVGAYRILTVEARSAALYLIGFVTGPVAAAAVLGEGGPRRMLFILPFATVIAVYGLQYLVRSGSRWPRWCGIGLLIAMPIQFGQFYADYMGDYRVRAANWFEGNVRGALDATVEAATRAGGNPAVLISDGINPYVQWYWTYSMLTHDQTRLRSRTIFADLGTAPIDGLGDEAIIVAEAAARTQIVARLPDLREVATIREPDGAVSFYVWSRTAESRGEAARDVR